ncbi:dihydrofolate reductase family protein [Lactobacillus hamsteri]|nr:dihydrofolate reductase family protein [Lactobacillus hamsteri]
MNKPYIIVHMMSSIDGRIDCDMTAQLRGNKEYYDTLSAINCPSNLSGRVTAETELTSGGKFEANNPKTIGKEAFSKNNEATGYNIVVDTKGTLLWGDDANANQPHLIITSEQASKEYLDYLTKRHISWIAVGEKHIDLKRAMEILADEFDVERLSIVGGGHINGGMLEAGLVDEISLVIGPGVDGRGGETAVFDGMNKNSKPISLKVKDVKTYDDGAIWLRYLIEK